MKSRLFAVLAVLAASLTACSGGSSGPDGAGEEKIPVTFLIAEGPEELTTFQDIVDSFNQSQSDIEATIIPVSEEEDLVTRLSTDIAGGRAPDVFFANYRYVDSFVTKGLLESVQGKLDSSTAFKADDFYPVAMEAFNFDGQQYCLPFNASSLVVYYNKDLFESAGLEAPSPDWTWNDMVGDAKSLTGLAPVGGGASDEDTTSGIGVDPQLIRVAPFILSNGGELADDVVNPTKLTLTSPPAIEAMQAFLDLGTVGEVTPSEAQMESEGVESLFANGRLGMIMESRKVVPGFRNITGFDWDVAPLPQFKEPMSILHSDGYCMTKGSEHPAEAWTFLEYAAGEAGQEISAESGRAVPSMISVADSKAFLDPDAAPASSQVFLDNLDHLGRVPQTANWVEIEDLANPQIEEGFFEGAGAEEVAVGINSAAKPLLAETSG